MEKYTDIRKYTNFDEMLEKEEVDIFDICLPTYPHADFSVKAMEKGINVICEKPMSIKYEDALLAVETAEKYGVQYGIIFQCR